MDKHFALEYWQDDNWFVGRLKEVPSVFSQGETISELEENIIDAYSMMAAESNTVAIPSSSQTKDLVINI